MVTLHSTSSVVPWEDPSLCMVLLGVSLSLCEGWTSRRQQWELVNSQHQGLCHVLSELSAVEKAHSEDKD